MNWTTYWLQEKERMYGKIINSRSTNNINSGHHSGFCV
jgi:hypothetical protein